MFIRLGHFKNNLIKFKIICLLIIRGLIETLFKNKKFLIKVETILTIINNVYPNCSLRFG